MMGDESEHQEKDCYHGDEDASRDPRSVETGSHAKRSHRRILQLAPINEVMRSGRLRLFGRVKRKDPNNVTRRVMDLAIPGT